MPRTIYNEGRVVGYSAYEMYVRHALSVDPTHTPASEKEWLASMMGMGSSMLLRVGTDTVSGAHYRDVQLPTNTRLCAANTIMGSLFLGSGHLEGTVTDSTTGWATRVTDYGPLIQNDSEHSPNGTVGPTGVIPPTSTSVDLSAYQAQIRSYLDIIDGIMIQPGTWTANESGDPAKDFTPNLAAQPRLRIAFNGPVTTPFYLLLTGLTNRTVVGGVTGFASADVPQSPADGDFLGPWEFPWSAKVIFTVPASMFTYVMNNKYERKLPITSVSQFITADPIIDMQSGNPKIYYDTYDTDAPIDMEVHTLATIGDSAAVLATYRSDPVLPPALFGAKVTGIDSEEPAVDNKIYPLDSVAPGNLKLYKSTESIPITDEDTENSAYTKAVAMETLSPGTSAFMRDEGTSDSSYVVYQLNQNRSRVPVSDNYYASLYGVLSFSEPIMPYIACQHNTGEEPDSVGFSIIGSTRLYGRLSQKFAEDYGLIYNSTRLNNLLAYGVNKSAYDSIPVNERSNYYYILKGPKNGASQGAQWVLIPVNKTDGTIDYIDKYYYTFTNLSDFNTIPWIIPSVRRRFDSTQETGWVESPGSYAFAADATVYRHSKPYKDESGNWVMINEYPAWIDDTEFTATETANYNATKSNLDIMGSWWESGGSTPSHETLAQYLPASITATAHIVDRSRAVPLGSSTYADWQERYRNTLLRDLPNGTNIINAIAPAFRNLTLAEFVNVSRLYDTITGEPITYRLDNNLYEGRLVEFWLASAEDIPNSNIDLGNVTCSLSFSVALNAANQNKTNLIPIPQQYQSTDGPLAAIGISGNRQTMSLSMADANNTPYPLAGVNDVIAWDDIARGTLHWDDIVAALAYNKSIDLLGPILRNLQVHVTSSGSKYIQLLGSPRLYISTSEPTGDIPENSIGIGW